MNTELLLKIADTIEEHQHLYTQGTYGMRKDPRECGTACCVAGWAIALSPGGFSMVDINDDIPLLAMNLLRLSGYERMILFDEEWPAPWFVMADCQEEREDDYNWVNPTASQAVNVLRAMAKNPGDFFE